MEERPDSPQAIIPPPSVHLPTDTADTFTGDAVGVQPSSSAAAVGTELPTLAIPTTLRVAADPETVMPFVARVLRKYAPPNACTPKDRKVALLLSFLRYQTQRAQEGLEVVADGEFFNNLDRLALQIEGELESQTPIPGPLPSPVRIALEGRSPGSPFHMYRPPAHAAREVYGLSSFPPQTNGVNVQMTSISPRMAPSAFSWDNGAPNHASFATHMQVDSDDSDRVYHGVDDGVDADVDGSQHGDDEVGPRRQGVYGDEQHSSSETGDSVVVETERKYLPRRPSSRSPHHRPAHTQRVQHEALHVQAASSYDQQHQQQYVQQEYFSEMERQQVQDEHEDTHQTNGLLTPRKRLSRSMQKEGDHRRRRLSQRSEDENDSLHGLLHLSQGQSAASQRQAYRRHTTPATPTQELADMHIFSQKPNLVRPVSLSSTDDDNTTPTTGTPPVLSVGDRALSASTSALDEERQNQRRRLQRRMVAHTEDSSDADADADNDMDPQHVRPSSDSAMNEDDGDVEDDTSADHVASDAAAGESPDQILHGSEEHTDNANVKPSRLHFGVPDNTDGKEDADAYDTTTADGDQHMSEANDNAGEGGARPRRHRKQPSHLEEYVLKAKRGNRGLRPSPSAHAHAAALTNATGTAVPAHMQIASAPTQISASVAPSLQMPTLVPVSPPTTDSVGSAAASVIPSPALVSTLVTEAQDANLGTHTLLSPKAAAAAAAPGGDVHMHSSFSEAAGTSPAHSLRRRRATAR